MAFEQQAAKGHARAPCLIVFAGKRQRGKHRTKVASKGFRLVIERRLDGALHSISLIPAVTRDGPRSRLARNPQVEMVKREIPSLAGALALGCLYWRAFYLYPNGFTEIAGYMFIVLASMAVIGLATAARERHFLQQILAGRCAFYSSTALLFCAVLRLGTYQFGGYDESGIVHAAAFYAHGLRPMIDFQSAVPPLFLAGIRLALICFGLHWLSFALLAAGFAAVTFVWVHWLLRRVSTPARWALVLSLAVEGATMVVVPFWWYNNVTSLATVLLLLSIVACIRTPAANAAWFSLAVAMAMVITGKPNAAPSCLAVLVVFATHDRYQWIRGAFACSGAITLAALICRFAQTPPALLRASYSEVAQLRGNPFLAYPWKLMDPLAIMFESAFVLLLVLCATDLVIKAGRRRAQSWQVILACGAIIVTSLLMVFTNAEVEITNLVGMVVGCSVLCFGNWENEEEGAQAARLLIYLVAIFTVTAGFLGFTHSRIRSIGERAFYEPYGTRMIDTGFFRGLEAGPRLLRVLAQTQQALDQHPSRVVFFGPRMEFSYAVFDRPVMWGMPLFWDSEGNFSPKRFPQMIADIRDQDPDILIFLKNDYTRMGAAADYIKSAAEYQRLDCFEDITVYVRKRVGPAAPHQRSAFGG